jgi:hypothetical protein
MARYSISFKGLETSTRVVGQRHDAQIGEGDPFRNLPHRELRAAK